MPEQSRSGFLLGCSVLVVLAALAVLGNAIAEAPDRDSGVFLYAGQRILAGDVPYRDFWDHKGPAIYYIDALGLLIGGGSEWGIWLVEFVALSAAGLVGYGLLVSAFGETAGFFGSALWMLVLPFVLSRGNMTEEYALPFQFIALFSFWRGLNQGSRFRWYMIAGAALGICMLLRPNGAGLGLAILIGSAAHAWQTRQQREFFVGALGLVSGATLVILPALAYLWIEGAFADFLDAVFRFNTFYVVSSFKARFESAVSGLRVLLPSGLSVLALGGWFLAGRRVLARPTENGRRALLFTAWVGLPVEMLLSSISGRSYVHYYMAWLPVAAVLAGGLVSELARDAKREVVTLLGRSWHMQPALAALLAAAAVLPARGLLPPLLHLNGVGDERDLGEGPRVIEEYARPDQSLLMWGAESTYNFFTRRRAPTRFVYQSPLIYCGYPTEQMARELAEAIATARPVVIDASSGYTRIPPIDPARRAEWASPERDCALFGVGQALAFIDANYQLVHVIEPSGWGVYQFQGP